MDQEPLIPGRSYLVRVGTKVAPASITAIKYKIDVNTAGTSRRTRRLSLNDIGFCNISTASPIAFDPYEQNSQDRRIHHHRPLHESHGRRRHDRVSACAAATNIHWQPLLVGKSERAALKKQKPAIVWFTGLSGAGKSTIANIVEQRLHARRLPYDDARRRQCAPRP